MVNATGKRAGRDRVFLFLQGPHGPFFAGLAAMLVDAGATCWRVAFNAGDAAFWPDKNHLIQFDAPVETWAEDCAAICTRHGVTDLVLYGDTRPVHAAAVKVARARGLRIHVFEEGYLRPYWVTYERGGSNGHSRLMSVDVARMRRALERWDGGAPTPPDKWGDLRQHMFYGALYHWFLWARRRRYRHFEPHRQIAVSAEFLLQLRRLLRMPFSAIQRRLATRRIRASGHPYHVVLLQLEHDASFRSFSGFGSQTEFVREVIDGFATGAPDHHHLVFKAHPLEDDRAPLRRTIEESAARAGLTRRVHVVRGSKLAPLIGGARTAVTVNSTAAHQALWRGTPVRVFGTSVYDKPELVSRQPLADFFADPQAPDRDAYACFRAFLLETSQIAGGFYSRRGRAQLLRNVTDRVLAAADPYDALLSPDASTKQQLRVAG